MQPQRLPRQFQLDARRLHLSLSRCVLVVSVAAQTVFVYEQERNRPGHRLVRRYRCSTSRFGVGQTLNSNRTPLGLHRIAQRIGGGWPIGTVFRDRKAVGLVWDGQPQAPIAHRLLWLDGLEPGLNRGGRVDTHRRYIYLHGLGNELTLGRPASRGCIHLAAADLLPLYDRLAAGTLVWITRR